MELNLKFTPKTKVCSCCGETKPVVDFYREAYTDQPTHQCRVCINTKRRVMRDKAKHGKFVSKEKHRNMEAVDYPLQDWKDVMVYFKGSCAFCLKPEGRARADKLDRDHLVAISKGGKTTRANIIPACTKCNRGRGNKDWEDWFKGQPFYSAKQAEHIRSWVQSNRPND